MVQDKMKHNKKIDKYLIVSFVSDFMRIYCKKILCKTREHCLIKCITLLNNGNLFISWLYSKILIIVRPGILAQSKLLQFSAFIFISFLPIIEYI